MRLINRLVTVAALGVGQASCSTSVGLGGLNGPCERNDDCMAGLSCRCGVCVLDENLDGGPTIGDAQDVERDAAE